MKVADLVRWAIAILAVLFFLGIMHEKNATVADTVRMMRELSASAREAQTLTTAKLSTVEAALKDATAANESLREEVARLKGTITAVATGHGPVVVTGSHVDTVLVGTGDFDLTVDDDPWVTFRVRRAGDLLRTNYRTTFSLHETDIEKTLPGGIKTHLYDVAIVSDLNGDTLRVPVVRNYVELAGIPDRPRLRLRPLAHLSAAVTTDGPEPAAGISLLAWGRDRQPSWTFGRVDLVPGDTPALGVAPVAWNMGEPTPIFTNVHLSAGWFFTGRTGFYLTVGAIL